MKKRLKEMEDEAAALREMQAKVEKEMGSVPGEYFLCFFLGRGRGLIRLLFAALCDQICDGIMGFLLWKLNFVLHAK